jgi:hypothetical protein
MTQRNARNSSVDLILASAACGAVAIMIILDRGFYTRIANDAFFSIGLASVAIVFVHVRPWREIWQLVVGFVVLLIGQRVRIGVPVRLAAAGAVLGIAALTLLAFRRIWSTLAQEKRRLRLALLPPLLMVLLDYFNSGWWWATGASRPLTLDLYLYSFDGSLGTEPSFDLGRVMLRSAPVMRIGLFCYLALPAILMLVYAQLLTRHERVALNAFLAFVLVGPLGIIFYNLFPACGPAYLFPHFPRDAMTLQQLRQLPLHPVAVQGARNAFPSLHMAWALLALWYSRELSRWMQILLWVFLAATVLATLGLGEHYFIDLVAAVPFASIVWFASFGDVHFRGRRGGLFLMAGLLWMVAWVVLLRFAVGVMWMSPLIPWTLIVGTVSSCIFWQNRISRPQN